MKELTYPETRRIKSIPLQETTLAELEYLIRSQLDTIDTFDQCIKKAKMELGETELELKRRKRFKIIE